MSYNVEWDYGETQNEHRNRMGRGKGVERRDGATGRSRIEKARETAEDQSAELRGQLHRYWNWVL